MATEQPITTDHEIDVILTNSDVKVIVQQRLSKRNFRVLNWDLESRGKANGYLGQYYTLRVTVKSDETIKTLKFFVKTPPPKDSPQYDFILRYDTFNKEIIAYTEMIQRMGTGRGFKWLVDCYLCKRDLVIVLEDATVDGYVTPDKYVPFDESHCVWMLRALSKLHSRSLILDNVLRRDGCGIWELYGHLLGEVLFAEQDEMSRKTLSSGVKAIYTLIDLVEGLTLQERTLIKDRLDIWCRTLPRLLQASKKYRNAICHRDLWGNNIMFKRDQSGNPIGCYILDFQFFHYCPPAVDFAVSLYLTTSKAVRDKHFESFAKVYHDFLIEGMKEEGHDVGSDLSWDIFWESCRFARSVAIIYGILNIQVQLLGSDVVEQFMDGPADNLEKMLYSDERTELVRQQYQTVTPYRQRLTEIIFEIRDNLPDEPPDV